jgi:threonine-phosphate decarboxylase
MFRRESRIYGVGAGDFIDFSSNMNPLGPPACVPKVMREWTEMNRYPDPGERDEGTSGAYTV